MSMKELRFMWTHTQICIDINANQDQNFPGIGGKNGRLGAFRAP